ncbi:heterokaryon incompatibility protein het-6-like protein [Colletotrichum kahawae]|uniref:Heterokaryon incompatibility protein het-6-like protein n=1 Tax=Colletotrichum kahawae TaxID=34407 RepID=A0AAD9YH53_COLKA|nr:heterokaryon incompatibility protein het-6-like protein [Colletotrichum kahawae]
MTRWHRESCSNPVIIVEQRVPSCKSCNASPDLKAIISAQSAERLSPSAIPPDEPPGQLNLWWPPCVPYASETPDAEAVVDGCLSDSVPKVDSSVNDTGNLHHISRDPVYPWQLHDDNIRLLRLTPVTDIDAPVYVELEIHDDKRYPDYETKMATALFASQSTLANIGTFLCKQATAGKCSDTSAPAETYESSGLMPYALISATFRKERNRLRRWG